MTSSRFLRLVLVCVAACGAGSALALCSVAGSTIAFGRLQTLAGTPDKTSTGNLSVTCENLLSAIGYTLRIGRSSYQSAIAPRRMTNPLGGVALAYDLYVDPSHATVWGDGTVGATVSGNMAASLLPISRNHTIFGRIPAGQTQLQPGQFSDQLVVTVSYAP